MTPFALACFLGAFLLFGLEPLMGKYALPAFGGGPTVWSACMLFYQADLLLGYAYAHVLATRLTRRRQVVVHAAVLALVLAWMLARGVLHGSPLAFFGGSGRVSALGVVSALGMSAGLPFFVLASTAPLLQTWFHAAYPERTPYRLYAVSNTGSALALLSYPFLIEPRLGRAQQAWTFAVGYVLFVGLCLFSGRRALGVGATASTAEVGASEERPSASKQLAWVFLAATATVLLLAITERVSGQVAAGPFVWVLFLAVYLLTFVLAFENEALYLPRVFGVVFALGLFGVVLLAHSTHRASIPQYVAAYATALFGGCMMVHGELYRARPDPVHLSRFYLLVSLGGVSGGVLVSLLAPALFRDNWEMPASLLTAGTVALYGLDSFGREVSPRVRVISAILGLGILALGAQFTRDFMRERGEVLLAERNFFGVLSVTEVDAHDPEETARLLKNGAIVHGLEYVDPARRHEPTTYYSPSSGLSQAIHEERALAQASGRATLRMAMLGLGVGSIAPYTVVGDSLDFYEINPLVTALARGQGGYFDFLQSAAGHVQVIEGDARRSLASGAEHPSGSGYDVLAVDTFSGDAIPVHLLTVEAFRTYLANLAPDGILLAIHVSNPHFDLASVVGADAARVGLHGWRVRNEASHEYYHSEWALLTRSGTPVDPHHFAGKERSVHRLEARSDAAWTDERNALVPALAP